MHLHIKALSKVLPVFFQKHKKCIDPKPLNSSVYLELFKNEIMHFLLLHYSSKFFFTLQEVTESLTVFNCH